MESESLSYRRGYLATDGADRVRNVVGWKEERFGTLAFQLHPDTPWVSVTDDRNHVAVVGEPVDVIGGVADRAQVAERILQFLVDGTDAAVKYIASLGGRATVFLIANGETIAIPDCASTLPLYWISDHRRLAFSNYAHLLGELDGVERNTPLIEFMREARAHPRKRVLYWPGVETPYIGVTQVLANHMLRVDRTGRVAHRRFYPHGGTTEFVDADAAYMMFEEMFLEHVRLLSSLTDLVGVSLTGGRDSRTTLMAALAQRERSPIETWTFTRQGRSDFASDAEVAQSIATAEGLPHRLVNLDAPGEGPRADAAAESYRRTFRYTQQFRSVPLAYLAQLPADILELHSLVAECGTGFYRRRQGKPTADLLRRMYQDTSLGEHKIVRDAFDRYVAYAGLDGVKTGAWDWQDLYYMEGRVGRWGALRIQEIELAHRVHLPFNARPILEALVYPAFEERVEKQALERFVKRMSRRS